MRAQVRYYVERTTEIEFDRFENISSILNDLMWQTEGMVTGEKPMIFNISVTDFTWAKEIDGNVYEFYVDKKNEVRPATQPKTREEWASLYRAICKELAESNSHWSEEKVRYMAQQQMPMMPRKEQVPE